MKIYKLFVGGAIAMSLAGCMSLGIDRMSPEQLRATNGMVTCTRLLTMYGQGIATSVNIDDLRKHTTSKSKISMAGDCTITIEGDVGTNVPAKPEPLPK